MIGEAGNENDGLAHWRTETLDIQIHVFSVGTRLFDIQPVWRMLW